MLTSLRAGWCLCHFFRLVSIIKVQDTALGARKSTIPILTSYRPPWCDLDIYHTQKRLGLVGLMTKKLSHKIRALRCPLNFVSYKRLATDFGFSKLKMFFEETINIFLSWSFVGCW